MPYSVLWGFLSRDLECFCLQFQPDQIHSLRQADEEKFNRGKLLNVGQQLNCSLNSLKGGYVGDYIGEHYGAFAGDARSLDHSAAVNVSGHLKFKPRYEGVHFVF